MNEQQWSYYKTEEDQGQISLEDLLNGVASGRFDLHTFIKPSKGLYWSQVQDNQEILFQLPWCYKIDNAIQEVSSGKEIVSLYQQEIIHANTYVKLVEGKVWEKLKDTFLILEVLYHLPWSYEVDHTFYEVSSGEELISLYRQGVIQADTYVKLIKNEEWKKLRDTFLWKRGSCEGFLPKFYGYSCLPPQRKVKLGFMLDTFLFCLPTIFWILYFLYSYRADEAGFQEQSLVISYGVFLWGGIALISCFQAIFLHLFGSTLGLRLLGIYILTAKQEKLSWLTAFKRQFSFFLRSRKSSKKQIDYYKKFGAGEWDIKHSIIISNKPPKVDNFIDQEN